MRKRIFQIIEKSDGVDKLSTAYDWFMIAVIIISIIPLATKNENAVLLLIDKVTVTIFIIDYLLRLLTADYKYNNSSVKSFIRYPFSFMAIIDILSILPSLTAINRSFKMLRLLRLLRAMRVFRVFKTLRYSKNFEILVRVLKKTKDSLIAVGMLAVAYIIVSALVILNVEPDSFENYFDAVYWATVSLTTVGYGDIYPITNIGRLVTMVSSVFGIAVVALPAGIITAGYMDEIRQDQDDV